MKLYLMADLEGVAGVLDFQEWVVPGQHHYQEARELATLEVNAAVDGFFEGGVTEILVADGHGPGALDIRLLDSRVDLLRGWGGERWPRRLDRSFDALAFVGQHAKEGTECAHLAHTLSLAYIDLSINGVSVGEFGALVMCASELGIPTIFASGDAALTREAAALVPGVETVEVKRGLNPGTGDDLAEKDYARFTSSAIHLHPTRARQLIRSGARRAVCRMKMESFGLIALRPPFEVTRRLRPNGERPEGIETRTTHLTSVIAALNASS